MQEQPTRQKYNLTTTQMMQSKIAELTAQNTYTSWNVKEFQQAIAEVQQLQKTLSQMDLSNVLGGVTHQRMVRRMLDRLEKEAGDLLAELDNKLSQHGNDFDKLRQYQLEKNPNAQIEAQAKEHASKEAMREAAEQAKAEAQAVRAQQAQKEQAKAPQPQPQPKKLETNIELEKTKISAAQHDDKQKIGDVKDKDSGKNKDKDDHSKKASKEEVLQRAKEKAKEIGRELAAKLDSIGGKISKSVSDIKQQISAKSKDRGDRDKDSRQR